MDTTTKPKLSQLGNKVALPSSAETAVLETIPVKNELIKRSVVRFSIPEFTSLCPITSQPDFAHFYIDYVPNELLIESKSLKLFMGSFRNEGAFHEEVTTYIAARLVEALNPTWFRITGIWFARGGIPIDIFFTHGALPKGMVAPYLKLDAYRGR